MKRKLIGHLKSTGEKVYVYELGVTKFFMTETSERSTVNGLLKTEEIEFLK